MESYYLGHHSKGWLFYALGDGEILHEHPTPASQVAPCRELHQQPD